MKWQDMFYQLPGLAWVSWFQTEFVYVPDTKPLIFSNYYESFLDSWPLPIFTPIWKQIFNKDLDPHIEEHMAFVLVSLS